MTNNRRTRPVLAFAVTLLLWLSIVTAALADSARIKEAEWKAEDRRLVIKARGDADSVSGRRVSISVTNAASGDTVFEKRVRRQDDGDWELEKKQWLSRSAVPCRVRLQAGTASTEADVEHAPDNCVGGAVNQAPTADAGLDQDFTLASGQNRVAVTLDGSGSSDPDGQISSFLWSGSPDPADVVGPTVELGEGSHAFTLVVADDDGADSDPDAVTITVHPAPGNQAPTADAGPDQTLTLAGGQNSIAVTLDGSGSADPDNGIAAYTWTGAPDPDDQASPTVTLGLGVYTFTLVVTDTEGAASAADTVTVRVTEATACLEPIDPPNVSINSTAVNSDCQPSAPVSQVAEVPNTTVTDGESYSILAINDLGMHCGDLDTRISSILPPFQVLLGQVVQKGSLGDARPVLNPAGISLRYSAAANPNDPMLGSALDGMMADGSTFKTNFWDYPVLAGAYDAFYPAFNPFNPAQALTPLAGPPFNVTGDLGLPVPNVEELYIGPDGLIGSGDESLVAVQHAMPGLSNPYTANVPQEVQEHFHDKPFFTNFPFGYVAEGVDWYEAAGIPFAAFDDFGRENAYPLVRVEARSGNTTVSTVDTVLPISGEASCTNCHATRDDYVSVHGDDADYRSDAPTHALAAELDDPATGEVEGVAVSSMDDPDANVLPPKVSLEYAADINILRLHDLKHGSQYVSAECSSDNLLPGQTCLDAGFGTPCSIDAANPNGDGPNCLTYQALPPDSAPPGTQPKPIVCQVCHYTPALDLAQLGPLSGAPGTVANGRNQLAHKSNSNVMHGHHGQFTDLFTPIPAASQTDDGIVTNQAARVQAVEESCYQCHPGKTTQCLRGAMYNGGMLCSDCHGDMAQVGNDFTANVSPSNPGPKAFALDPNGNFYDQNDPQPRVPWANEPGCGSCHTGDATDNLAGMADVMVNTRDLNGNVDLLRLRQAYRSGDAKATPIVPSNKRFAEPAVPASFNGFDNPGAGNPQLYRVSTGHGGVMCEGCHGATHAEWPNANPNANDNVTANQLQGHTGTLIECSTCHTGDLGNTLGGPHGLHPVGNTRFARGGHEHMNPQNCKSCHGTDGRGTVLSITKAERRLECKDEKGTLCAREDQLITVPRGTVIGCVQCHENYINGED